jgi:membrane protein implicated in regulation of membrane protease activity
MKKNYEYGVEGFVGEYARVAFKLGPMNDAQYMVKVHGELWGANSIDDLEPGDKVKILSANGLILVVGKVGKQP